MKTLTAEEAGQWLEQNGPGTAVYLLGAGGCGMSGLGHLLLDLGLRVAGSDLGSNQETRQLEWRGARIQLGHDAAALRAARPGLVVYSSAIRRDNPELKEAEANGIPMVRRAALLAALLEGQRGICVAGMHGKTTTAALLAFALENLNAQPSYAIGSLVAQLERHARLSQAAPAGVAGSAPFFVVETDESDGTLTHFRPEMAIVLNVDEEHLDYYANLEAVCREFDQFVGQVRGPVFFCADDARLAELMSRRSPAISFGFHSLANYRVERVRKTSVDPAGAAAAFTVWRAGEKLGDFTLSLLGDKNISNAAGVIALLHELGYGAREIAGAIAPFQGAARRQQELFRDERFRVFEDYGHHPSEIQATLRALKELGGRRLLVAFQPHRFTRTQHLFQQFASCFSAADRLWLTEIYPAHEAGIPGITGESLAEAIRASGCDVTFTPGLEELNAALGSELSPGDVVVFLGAGDITRAAHQMAAELRALPGLPKDRPELELKAVLSPESVVRADEPLARRTTLRVGGRADLYVEPASEEELGRVLRFCAERQMPFTLLGRGSNLLIRDGGIRGVVICLAHPFFMRLQIAGDQLQCGAGAKLKTVAVEARRAGLAGLEFLEGIPGSVGGGLRMNAGAMGCWIFEVVERIRFMSFTGEVFERKGSEVSVEYRGCPLFKNHVALGAVLRGVPAASAVIGERMKTYSQKRWQTQPAAPSAGCIFKNPAEIPAGKLVEELGLKGTRVGGASVSEVHGNFIVNDGTATARDVLNLIGIIKERARTSRGIVLETEVEILGE